MAQSNYAVRASVCVHRKSVQYDPSIENPKCGAETTLKSGGRPVDERSESDETGLSDGFLLAVLRDAGRPGGAVGAALISLQNDETRYNHEVLARKINIGVATALETT